MTILFSNSSPKLYKSWNFGPKLKDFHFCTKLCNKTNLRTQISNMTIVFSNSTPKICKSGIFGPKFKDFYFVPNVAISQIRRRWFQIWQWLFRIPVWKYPNIAVFVLNVSTFYFCRNLRILKNSRVLISKMVIVFSNSSKKFSLKTQKYFFLVKLSVNLILFSRI